MGRKGASAHKTHTTAIVAIPPLEVWEPIQAIRRQHDRKMRRWMPHVTLVYPFRSPEAFDELEPLLAAACRELQPFEIELARLRHFRHGRKSATLWLEPEPGERLREIERALRGVVPDCDDQARHRDGFTPHLSVGQFRGSHAEVLELERALQREWQPVSFGLRAVSLIWRGEPPDDVFRVDRAVALGGVAEQS